MKRLTVGELASVRTQLLAAQKNRCALCGHHIVQGSADGPVVDHDHESGRIRAVLHRSCNGALGKVELKARLGRAGVSAIEFIIGAGKYHEHHSVPRIPLIHPSHRTEDEKRLAKNAKARKKRAAAKAAKGTA